MAVSSANSVQRAGMKKKVVYVERKQKRVQYLVVHRILRDSRAREREGEREGERERERERGREGGRAGDTFCYADKRHCCDTSSNEGIR